ncbi:MAG: neutral/alkaline ceramidase [bacterium]|nr:neutral/alkaline ceramidase [bacterium]
MNFSKLTSVILFLILIAFSGCFDEGDSAATSGDASLGSGSSIDYKYEIGSAITDITGPPAEVMFGGYCAFDQKGKGIYMRQFARAFAIKDRETGKHVVMAVADISMLASGVYVHVLNKIKANSELNDVFNEDNVVLSATHTHSGPGGYFKTYALNIFVGMTFHEDNFNTIVDGIYDAICQAYKNMDKGSIYLNSGEFSAEEHERVSRNRSPEGYYLNRDIADYLLPNGDPDDANRIMTQLKMMKENNSPLGIYNWTPIHPNTAGSKLKLINGDILGLSAYLFETEQGLDYVNKTGFIAAFAQNDCGDTSSNLPEDSELFGVDLKGSPDWVADGSHDYERMALRADTVTDMAKSMYNSTGEELKGDIEYRQIFVDVQEFPIRSEFIHPDDVKYAQELGETTDNRQLCRGAAGIDFMAGSTEDGISGMVPFEGHPRDVTDYSLEDPANIFTEPLPIITDLLMNLLVPSDTLYDEMDCQLEKTMALSFDELNNLIPNGKAWNLNMPFQIIKIGDKLAIVTLPLEVSTMAGRRIKAEVKKVISPDIHVVINATSNSDGRYLTTREEYASQQYEGGATLLGPYELNAVTQVIHDLAASFAPGTDLPDYGVSFEDVEDGLEDKSIFQVSGNVVFDDKPLNKSFGSVKSQPAGSYSRGNTASAVFWGAHPNNNTAVGSKESFIVIEKKTGSRQECREEKIGCNTETICTTIDSWSAVAYDWDPSTTYEWARSGVANSLVTIKWTIPADTEPGEYRIRHIGQWKSGWTWNISRYEGASRTFTVQ